MGKRNQNTQELWKGRVCRAQLPSLHSGSAGLAYIRLKHLGPVKPPRLKAGERIPIPARRAGSLLSLTRNL